MWRQCKLYVNGNASCGRSATHAGTVVYSTDAGSSSVTLPLCDYHGRLIAGRLDLGVRYRVRGTMEIIKVWPLAHIAQAKQPKTR
jgi:hypothetical protein